MISMRALPRFGGIFDYEKKLQRLVDVTRELENQHVWEEPLRASLLGKERAVLQKFVSTFDQLTAHLRDARELLQMVVAEQDESSFVEVVKEVDQLEKMVSEMEFRRMFSGKMDSNNA